MNKLVIEHFAKQLNTDQETLYKAVEALEKSSGKQNVLEKFYEENKDKIEKAVTNFGLSTPTAEELHEAIKKNIVELDTRLFDLLEQPVCTNNEGCQNLISAVLALHTERTGFFIKRKVAEELLAENPPENIMKALDYRMVSEMLEKEDLFEIYAALRFMEPKEWLNGQYIAAYKKLRPEDFEIRPIEIRVLERKKWAEVAEKFVTKKLHSMSHLKEMGIIFVVPVEEHKQAMTLYLFAMTLHYLDEVNLYSKYFQYHTKHPDFADKLVSAIRGEVPEIEAVGDDPYKWLIIQRYLRKENKNDPRLAVQHINPESLYHRSSSRTLIKLSHVAPSFNIGAWEHTNYVAADFPSKDGGTGLVDLNFMDSVMSVLNDLDYKDYYAYHFHESLWNKIFIEYFSVETLEDLVIRYLDQGVFDLNKEFKK